MNSRKQPEPLSQSQVDDIRTELRKIAAAEERLQNAARRLESTRAELERKLRSQPPPTERYLRLAPPPTEEAT